MSPAILMLVIPRKSFLRPSSYWKIKNLPELARDILEMFLSGYKQAEIARRRGIDRRRVSEILDREIRVLLPDDVE